MKIGIMSDSHGDRRVIDRAVERAGKVDLWLHAGDCAPDAAYLALVSAVRVENVAGNTDWPDGKTPDEIVVEAAGHRIFLTHGHIYAGGHRRLRSYACGAGGRGRCSCPQPRQRGAATR